MVTKKIEIQDHNGNIYHPHTTSDVVFMKDGKKLEETIESLKQSASNGKNIVATAIGTPLSSNDTFSQMGSKIDTLTQTFRNNLNAKGVSASNADKMSSLVDKVGDIKQSQPMSVLTSPKTTNFSTSRPDSSFYIGDLIFYINGREVRCYDPVTDTNTLAKTFNTGNNINIIHASKNPHNDNLLDVVCSSGYTPYSAVFYQFDLITQTLENLGSVSSFSNTVSSARYDDDNISVAGPSFYKFNYIDKTKVKHGDVSSGYEGGLPYVVINGDAYYLSSDFALWKNSESGRKVYRFNELVNSGTAPNTSSTFYHNYCVLNGFDGYLYIFVPNTNYSNSYTNSNWVIRFNVEKEELEYVGARIPSHLKAFTVHDNRIDLIFNNVTQIINK